jgi:hypothetical protein
VFALCGNNATLLPAKNWRLSFFFINAIHNPNTNHPECLFHNEL